MWTAKDIKPGLTIISTSHSRATVAQVTSLLEHYPDRYCLVEPQRYLVAEQTYTAEQMATNFNAWGAALDDADARSLLEHGY